MARAYLNALSFPASDLETALQLLSDLKAGISKLSVMRVMTFPVMCSLRASELPLTPAYEVLANGAGFQGGRFRDTVLFFLTALDQRSPAQLELDAALQPVARDFQIDGLPQVLDGASAEPLIACVLDEGVLLSIGSGSPWNADRVAFSALLAGDPDIRAMECDNIFDADSAGTVGRKLGARQGELLFDNWAYLTDDAFRSAQIIEWLEECRDRPGLEQLIMRTVNQAARRSYRIDGDLIKKLASENDITIFELRAYFSGSNNVRLLFSRDKTGRAYYGYGGLKTSGDWYDHAIPQAVRHIRDGWAIHERNSR